MGLQYFIDRTRWRMNPFIRGAYSYRTASFDPEILKPLGQQIGDDIVSHLIFVYIIVAQFKFTLPVNLSLDAYSVVCWRGLSIKI